MKQADLDYLFEVLETQNNGFYYFKDKLALKLLQWHVKDEMPISALRQTKWNAFLQKPTVKSVLAGSGAGVVRATDFNAVYPQDALNFTYSLDTWGETERSRSSNWYQTTQAEPNLVLQLNFDNWHNYLYGRYISKTRDWHPFATYMHPVATKRNYTLGWCRLDVNMESGEVILEEIQTDWLRDVKALANELGKRKNHPRNHWFFNKVTAEAFMQYTQHLAPYFKIWDEALLMLALEFIKEQLGIGVVYMHDFESGNRIKSLNGNYQPPRSLYTTLPKRSGFQRVTEQPSFIKPDRHLRKVYKENEIKWWKITL